MMEAAKVLDILKALNQGKIVESHKRYYKSVKGRFMYSDNLKEWKKSSITKEILKKIEWNVV